MQLQALALQQKPTRTMAMVMTAVTTMVVTTKVAPQNHPTGLKSSTRVTKKLAAASLAK